LPRPIGLPTADRLANYGALACVAVGAASAVPAWSDLGAVRDIVAAQLSGSAQGTDFLNLYAGAQLMLRDSAHVYDLEAQLAVQRGLTGWQSPIVPFFLPPYAAVLVSFLGLLPYGLAYLAWLLTGVACLVGAAVLLAPRWGGRWYSLVWLGLGMLYLPAFLGLAEGQTTALMLLAFAGFCRLFVTRHRWLLAACVLAWLLKPQLAVPLVVALLLARRFDVLLRVLSLVLAFSLAALLVMRPEGFAAYLTLALRKTSESFAADPAFLPGPTLLHTAHWFFGLSWPAHVLGLLLLACAWLLFVRVWRTRDAPLQLAALPVIATIGAPYALVHEMTAWLATFWLVYAWSAGSPPARATLLWLTAAIWLAADVGVALPLLGGAAIAAPLGLLLLWFLPTLAPAGQKLPAPARSRPASPPAESALPSP